jgi:hypothetical protein
VRHGMRSLIFFVCVGLVEMLEVESYSRCRCIEHPSKSCLDYMRRRGGGCGSGLEVDGARTKREWFRYEVAWLGLGAGKCRCDGWWCRQGCCWQPGNGHVKSNGEMAMRVRGI